MAIPDGLRHASVMTGNQLQALLCGVLPSTVPPPPDADACLAGAIHTSDYHRTGACLAGIHSATH